MGIVKCQTLNNWKYRNYGYRHPSLDYICEHVPTQRMSVSGFGIKTIIKQDSTVVNTTSSTDSQSTSTIN